MIAGNNKAPFLGPSCACLYLFWFWRVSWGVAMMNRLVTRMNAEPVAETVRFELTDGCPSAVFKTAGLNHSPKSPGSRVF